MIPAVLFWVAARPADPPGGWTVALGDSWQYRLEQTFLPMEAPEPEDEQGFTFEGSYRVTGVKTGGFDFARTSRLTRQKLGESVLPSIPDTPDLVETLRFASSGLGEDEPDRYAVEAEIRLSRLLWFVFPPEPNLGAWVAAIPSIRPEWGPGAKVEYRRSGKTTRLGRTCILYNVRYTEDRNREAMAAKGRMEIGEASGVLMAANLEAENAPLPGGESPQHLTLKYEVTALKVKSESNR